MSAAATTPVPQGVVCVLGMHRSGTSAVARTLDLLGVDFGPPEQLFPARVDNPEGFFEHKGLVEVNEEILRRFGGSWHEPPVFPSGWELSSLVSDLRERAARVMRDDFSERPSWGWKDPRACLTLPFWRPLLPPTRYVLCLRNPLAVARSLQLRDGFPIDKSGRLWLDHVISALTQTTSEPRLIVAYEDLVASWEPEVRRIARFLNRRDEGGEVTSQAIQASLRPDLQHHRASLQGTLAERALPLGARMLYLGLVLALIQHRDSPTGPEDMDAAVKILTQAVVEEQVASSASAADRQALLETCHRLLAVQEGFRTERDGLHAEVERLQNVVRRQWAALAELGNHPLWRAYRSLRFAVLPRGSRREGAYMRARRWLGPGRANR